MSEVVCVFITTVSEVVSERDLNTTLGEAKKRLGQLHFQIWEAKHDFEFIGEDKDRQLGMEGR